MITLRPYQTDIITQARALMVDGIHRFLIQSPTGSGKTLLTAWMLKSAAERGKRAVFMVHRRELVKQSIAAFGEVGLPHGVIAAGFFEEPRHAVQIASVQTYARRMARYGARDLFVWDECHHLAAGSWSAIFRAYPNAFHLGLTATPERLDGKGLGAYFDRMLTGPSVTWLIEQGYLARYRIFAPSTVSVAGVHTRMGDFATNELSRAADKPAITGDAIQHYQRLGANGRAVVFCVSIEHSKHVAEQFNAAGIPAAHVDGETDVADRDESIRRFQDGALRVLCNVDLFGEGFDLPQLEVAILLRPTQSLGLYLQQVGRALRPAPGKAGALILDHAGNCQRHGLPDDERIWSLEGRRGRSAGPDDAAVPVRVCPRCFAAQAPGRAACALCGHVFVVEARTVQQKDGDLTEIDVLVARRKRQYEQARCETLEDFIALGKARGYKPGWAYFVWQKRQERRRQPVTA